MDRIYLWSVVVGAGLFLAYWRQTWYGTWSHSYALMTLMVALGAVAVNYPLLLTPHYKVNVGIAVYFAALLLFGAPLAMLVAGASQVVGGTVLCLRHNPSTGRPRRRPLEVIFNTAQIVIYTGAGGLAYYAVLPQVAPAALDQVLAFLAIPVTAVAMYLANSVLVSTMVALRLKQHPYDVWREGRTQDVLQFAGLFLIGLLAALTTANHPWSLPVLIIPTVIIYLSLKRSVQLTEQTISAIEAMADMVDARDSYTFEHSKRVATQSERIARRLGLSPDEITTIRLAARVHDLGKMAIPDAVLHKGSELDAAEWAQMKRHPEIGCELLSRFPLYRQEQVKAIVLAHHERVDGAGYPRGLAGEQMPLGAQIIAVADAIDAMTSARPYRAAMPVEYALIELRRNKGIQWSVQVVDAVESLLTPPAPKSPMFPAMTVPNMGIRLS
jgi:HD-GYP domain-containing protein (c-di-GMP phosphodiesterase class II)